MDHSAIITLEVCFKQAERGKGYWKFNISLLRDNNYVNIVKKCIAETITTYKNPHFNVQDMTNLFVSMIIFLETLLMNIPLWGSSCAFLKVRNNESTKQR